jgi:hypothetical protein
VVVLVETTEKRRSLLMSTTPAEPEESPATDDAGAEPAEPTEPVGVEVGFVEGEGTTFEPEEDPEGAGDG